MSKLLNILSIVALAAVIVLIAGCSTVVHGENVETEGIKTIVGRVGYRERTLLPANAEILIALEDVARADAASDLVASTRFAPKAGQPWDFSLEYDPAKLHEKGHYALRARIEAEGRLLFISTQHIPAFDQSADAPMEIMLSPVVSRPTSENNQPLKPDASLTNTYWKLIELNGRPAELGAQSRELHMILATEGDRVHGFSGCNKFTGNYEKVGNQLRFKSLASTRMACISGMEQEKSFLDALESAVRYALSGESLSLYNAKNYLSLRFESVYLR